MNRKMIFMVVIHLAGTTGWSQVRVTGEGTGTVLRRGERCTISDYDIAAEEGKRYADLNADEKCVQSYHDGAFRITGWDQQVLCKLRKPGPYETDYYLDYVSIAKLSALYQCVDY